MLDELYAQWTMSQRILASARDLVGAEPRPRALIKAALENALMQRVLANDNLAPATLFAQLDVATLRFGLSCVALGDDLKLAIRLHEIVQTHLALQPTDLRAMEPLLEADTLRVGTWRHARNAPLERLLQFALARMPADKALRTVACAGLQYAALYAETRHIGPPQVVYDLFHDWGVRNEGFASPFNSRLLGKDHSGFFSAFARTDAPFGSRGSFFSCDWRDFEGAWCVDPPFLPETLQGTDTRIGHWRGQGGPSMLLIGPSSYEVTTPFDEEVRLRAGAHVYEGLDGGLHPLPVDVSIWRFGELEGFDACAIAEGYLPDAKAV